MIKQDSSSKIRLMTVAILVLLAGLASSAWCDLSDYDGYYAGTYSGDENGYWVASLSEDSDDYVFLSYAPATGNFDIGFFESWHENDGVGYFHIDATELEETEADCNIDSADGSVSGTWSNPYSGDSGTTEGQKMTSRSAYAGSRYSGTFTGDDTGTWTVTVASDGVIDGTMTSDAGGSSDIDGLCHPDGYLMCVNGDDADDGFVVFGAISGSSVSGAWAAEDGSEGTISGSGTTSGASTVVAVPGDSGGGGCFLQTLAERQ
ncbi:MAG: hypothetical protein SWH61_01190 [Thermodesulfobacteriota bacterium]|nr:hypothetical protein [Thermodesulfobacteriota bacterium]